MCRFEDRPTVLVEVHLAEENLGLAIAGFLVGVAEEVPLAIELVGGVVSHSEELAVRTDERVATTFSMGWPLLST